MLVPTNCTQINRQKRNRQKTMSSRGVNKVIIIGSLGQDPEQKSMPNGNAVTNISVATSEIWKDKTNGNKEERTEWHKVVFFNRLAEIAGQYLRKGSKVYLEGSLRTRKWQNQNGETRYSTEIIATEMQMIGDKQSNHQQNNEQPHQGQYYGEKTQQQQKLQEPQQRQAIPNNQPKAGYASGGSGYQSQQSPSETPDFDDDIPF